MKQNIINKDISVSPIAIGGNIFGYSCNSEDARNLLSFAEDNAINFIDTADVYSRGLSESIIGDALYGKRNRWVIASKIGVVSNHNGSGVLDPKNIILKLRNTLKRLKTDYLDIYQIHKFDELANISDVINCLEMLVEKGMIKSYGISNFSNHHINQFDKKKNNIVTHQLFYNFLKRRIFENVIGSFSDHKYILYGVLGRGVLTSKYFNYSDIKANNRASKSKNVMSDLKKEVINELISFNKKLNDFGTNLLEYSLSEAMSRENVVSCIIGLRKKTQLKEIINIYKKNIPIKSLRKYEPKKISDLVNLGEPEIK